jgi:hypothetical protein
LALKSAEYRFRFPVIKSVLQRGRTYLSQLSEFPAPPHSPQEAETILLFFSIQPLEEIMLGIGKLKS